MSDQIKTIDTATGESELSFVILDASRFHLCDECEVVGNEFDSQSVSSITRA